MEFVIRGSAEEIAALAAQTQGRQVESVFIGFPKISNANGYNLTKKNGQGIKMERIAWHR